MKLECILTQAELDREEYSSQRKLTGFRFRLPELIDKYSNKGDGTATFGSIKEFCKVQSAAYEKIKENIPESVAAALSSHLAAQVALRHSSIQNLAPVNLFSSRSISYQAFSSTADQLLQVYAVTLDEASHKSTLESITAGFFHWIVEGSSQHLEKQRFLSKDDTIKMMVRGDEYHFLPRSELLRSDSERKSSINVQDFVQKIDGAKNENLYLHGHQNVKTEFEKMGMLLSDLDYFTSLFDPKDLFRNYLLIGPPGTGKTTLVNHMARKSGLYFLKVPCVELGSKFFSETAANIHEVYKSARRILEREKPSGVIIFFDEFDQIAKHRGYGNSSESDSLVTTLNENLDGGSSCPRIITVGATNVEMIIDPAILSRFEILYMGYPSTNDEIIGLHSTIIQKMEARASRKLFSEIEYHKILPFSVKDERYKSGRQINKILHKAALEKVLEGFPQRQYQLVTTEDLVNIYRSTSFEKKESKMPIGYFAGVK